MTPRRAVALAIAMLALAAPASASADAATQVFFEQLAEQKLKPAPLVPTTGPRSLSPAGDFISTFDQPRGYLIRMGAQRRGRLVALVDLVGGQYPSVGKALRAFRDSALRRRPTVIRGKRGYVLTNRRARVLIWSESGVVYVLITSTPKTVSLNELRATAGGLERLEGVWAGNDERADNEVSVAATSNTVTVETRFSGQCVFSPTGEPSAVRRATTRVAFLRRQGNDFSFDIGPNLDRERSDLAWQGTVSGTVGTNGGTVNVRATGADAEDSCDTGPVSLTLRPFP